jgi:large subunit ribosomal protein L17
MRHRVHHRKLNRTSEHREALRRNMAQSLFEHGQITTTLPKAKDLRPFVEKLVTLAVRARRLGEAGDRAGSLAARRSIDSLMTDRAIIPSEHRAAYEGMSDAGRAKSVRMVSGRRYRTGEPKGRLVFTADSVTRRLIEKIAPRFVDRPGGYTRVIHLSDTRIGDSSRLAVLQLLGNEQAPGSLTKPRKSARRRRTDARYAMAVKAAKAWSTKGRTAGPDAGESPAIEQEST